MNNIEVLKDPKKEIEFWLTALSNPNVNTESLELLNKCLQIEINQYINPVTVGDYK